MAIGPGRVGAATLAEPLQIPVDQAALALGTLVAVLPGGRRVQGRPPRRGPLPLPAAQPPPLAHRPFVSSSTPPWCSSRGEPLAAGPRERGRTHAGGSGGARWRHGSGSRRGWLPRSRGGRLCGGGAEGRRRSSPSAHGSDTNEEAEKSVSAVLTCQGQQVSHDAPADAHLPHLALEHDQQQWG